MASVKSLVMAVILVVISIALLPTIWDAIYTDAVASGVNGTAWTLLQLVPFIYVGVTIIGGIVVGVKG